MTDGVWPESSTAVGSDHVTGADNVLGGILYMMSIGQSVTTGAKLSATITVCTSQRYRLEV